MRFVHFGQCGRLIEPILFPSSFLSAGSDYTLLSGGENEQDIFIQLENGAILTGVFSRMSADIQMVFDPRPIGRSDQWQKRSIEEQTYPAPIENYFGVLLHYSKILRQ